MQAVLREAGWWPERRVPTDEWEKKLVADGYWISPVFLQIAENLGGLRVNPVRTPQDRFASSPITFDPIRGLGEREGVVHIEQAFGVRCAPIGYTNNGEIVLFCGEDGQIFGMWNWDLVIYQGRCLAAAFEKTLLFAEGPLRRYWIEDDGQVEEIEALI